MENIAEIVPNLKIKKGQNKLENNIIIIVVVKVAVVLYVQVSMKVGM